MPFAFFKVPCDGGDDAARSLNACLASRRVVTVTREFVASGAESFWAFCVEHRSDGGASAPPGRGGGRIDYREVLPPDQFKRFARLREVEGLGEQRVAKYAAAVLEVMRESEDTEQSSAPDAKKE